MIFGEKKLFFWTLYWPHWGGVPLHQPGVLPGPHNGRGGKTHTSNLPLPGLCQNSLEEIRSHELVSPPRLRGAKQTRESRKSRGSRFPKDQQSWFSGWSRGNSGWRVRWHPGPVASAPPPPSPPRDKRSLNTSCRRRRSRQIPSRSIKKKESRPTRSR